MAIFHLTAKVISRGKGQSAIAASAYRSGEKLLDQKTGETKHYQARAERIQFEGVFAPQNAPDWARDRQQLWNHVEDFNTAKNARLAREIEIALPHELSDEQREWLVKDFVREQFTRKGFIVDAAIHAPDKNSDERNYHAHLMVTTRRLDGEEFEQIADREQNTHATLKGWREEWAHLANRHLERHGLEARIDHRTLEEQGIDREPGIHLGYAAAAMSERGASSYRYDALREIMERNDAIRLESAADRGQLQTEPIAAVTHDAPLGLAHDQSPAPEVTSGPTSGQLFVNEQATELEAGAAGGAADLAPRKDAADGLAGGLLAAVGKVADSLGSLFEGGTPQLTPQQQERVAQREAEAVEARAAQAEETRQAKATEAANRQQEAERKPNKRDEARALADWLIQRSSEREGREHDDGGRERD